MTTQAQILAVGWDHASSTDEYGKELRQAIANALSSLRIAGPWYFDRDQDWVRRPQGGHADDFVGLVVARNSLPLCRWSVFNPTPDEGHVELKSGHAITADEAKALADAALLEAGWVLCPQP